ncbi:hypothetical protein RJT34_19653 [Clitoria ternatea]|uniref:Uncharacterized protein n=1 Tax=Clitoria ternatea TaxID=43366 RepID=A0AAN9P4W7_CLITE
MEEERGNHQIIDMCEVDKEMLASMELKISQNPKLLSKVAGNKSCSIFRVPQGLAEVNGKAYQPRIVSIGPYHRGQPRLNMIEEHKWRYLGSLLSRTQHKGLTLEDLVKSITPLESQARDCYSETINLQSHEFIEMMVLDGCFIIELFRRVAKLVPSEPNDPLVTMEWILPFFYRDFLKLENQIPFFILHRLFEVSTLPGENSTPKALSTIALEFFSYSLALQRPEPRSQTTTSFCDSPNNNVKFFQDGGWSIEPDKVMANEKKHLLDLVRSCFTEEKTDPRNRVPTPTHVIHCVSKLRRSGIKIRPGKEGENFLHVTFGHGVIHMPSITMDDFMSSFLLNCVAFEQCYRSCSKHFTTYVTLLDCLINTYRDVEYLCEKNIIENHFGTEGEVAHFINNAGKDVAVDMDLCYLSQLFNDVHKYYRNIGHVQWASFKYTYFDTPWSFISALAALVLLLLTVSQTYFAAYQYFVPQKR